MILSVTKESGFETELKTSIKKAHYWLRESNRTWHEKTETVIIRCWTEKGRFKMTVGGRPDDGPEYLGCESTHS